MRHYLLVTAERRPMRPYELKDQHGRIRIGSMQPNVALARLELELTEPEFLQHAKDIALGCRVPGNLVYVAQVREDGEKEVEIYDNLTPFKKLEKAARDLGLDLSDCATNAERAEKINQARGLVPA